MLGRVYVVDDDSTFRTAIERRLTKIGYVVATYSSGQDLLDRLPSQSELGCILLDVRIPGLSGPELQRRLTELGSTLPIIFLTGHPDIPTTVQTIKAHRHRVMAKMQVRSLAELVSLAERVGVFLSAPRQTI